MNKIWAFIVAIGTIIAGFILALRFGKKAGINEAAVSINKQTEEQEEELKEKAEEAYKEKPSIDEIKKWL